MGPRRLLQPTHGGACGACNWGLADASSGSIDTPTPPTPTHKQALLGCFEEQMCKALLMENVDWQPLSPLLGVAEDGELARRANSRCVPTTDVWV